MPKFSTRAAAFHVDALVITVVFEYFHILLLQKNPEGVSAFLLIAIFAAITLLYSVVPTKLFGKTLGKKLYGLEVISDSLVSGAPSSLTWGQAFQRELFIKTISSLCLGFGFWKARHDPRTKAWHDELCRTRVLASSSSTNGPAKILMEMTVTLLTVIAGVGLTVWAMLYTSLPLPVLEKQFAAANIPLQNLSGSFGGGLSFKDFAFEGDHFQFQISEGFFQIDVVSSWAEGRLVLSKLQLQDVKVTYHGVFAWKPFVQNLLLSLTDPETSDMKMRIDDVVVNKLAIQSLQGGRTALTLLQSKQLSLEIGELTAGLFHSSSDGLDFKLAGAKLTEGLLSFQSLEGEIRPSLIPLLLKPLDFSAKGRVAVDPAQVNWNQVEGTFLKAGNSSVGKFSWKGENLQLTTKNLNLREQFKTFLPVSYLSVNLESKGDHYAPLLDHAVASYHTQLCGQNFLSEGNGAVWKSNSQILRLRFAAKNLPEVATGIFSKDATLDSFLVLLLAKNSEAPRAMDASAIAEFCPKPL